ncbi:MAG: RNA polymerase sigma-70 factor [Bacteroides sp.]|jgi:RNA polymerase sigma-70 factor (ECF subfamily)|nr:RNA polymerase sigma-70 factor [Bacteroides sp.]MCI1682028.1 RNA polymerase sigma-70 factor [Bacteroides sp.]
MADHSGFLIDRKDVFEKLFDEYWAILVSYVQRYIQREDIAEDIVQDLYVSLWEKQRSFTSIDAFRSFIYTSVRNSVLDYLKHQSVEQRYMKEAIREEFTHSIDEDFQKEEIYRLLFKQIDKLPKRCREIFLLSLEGNNNESIAKALSLSIETVKTQKKRAMKFLRDNLKDKYVGKNSIFLFFLLFMYLDLSI